MPDGKSNKPKAAETPVFLFMGGFTSCGRNGDETAEHENADPFQMDLYKGFKDIRDAFIERFDETPQYMLSCYSKDPVEVKYTLSSDLDGRVRDESVEQMLTDLTTFIASLENPVLYIVGHSYGGWTAMYTALNLEARFAVRTLATIDPISKVDCFPDQFLVSVLSGPAPGCTRAPEDFRDAGLEAIRARTANWLNYYQSQVSLLHSGPIMGVANVERQYGSGGFAPHSDFLTDAEVLDALRTQILEARATGP